MISTMSAVGVSSPSPAVTSSVPDLHHVGYDQRSCDNVTYVNSSNLHCFCPSLTAEDSKLKVITHGEIWTPEVMQRIVMLTVIMTLTFLGNVTIIFVLTFSKYRKLNTRVNIFIINLAVGDLTVCCFTMTTEVLFVVFEQAWMLGAAACKILLYVQIITLASTTFILTAMSFDRYLAICKPLKFGSSSQARKSIIIAWVMAFIFASPQLLIFKEVPVGVFYPDCETKYQCKSRGYTAWWQRKLYFTFMTVYILIVPAILISFCYINLVRAVWQQGKEIASDTGMPLRRSIGNKKTFPKAKIKTVGMTLCIICSFIICWTPYFVVHLIHIWTQYKHEFPEAVYVVAETLALLNSALNPIIYGCFNLKIKRGVMEVFCPSRVKRWDRTRGVSTRVTDYIHDADDNFGGNVNRASSRRTTTNLLPSPGHAPKGPSLIHPQQYSEPVLKEENKNGFKLRVKFKNSDSHSDHGNHRSDYTAELLGHRSDDQS